ncbi:hypothetical protein GCM10027176_15250 [Actinoallomurus bryophytorum]
METRSGAAGVTDGAVTGFLVDRVGLGLCVGVRDGLADLEGETDGDTVVWGEGVALVSCEGDELSISMGIRMSAPTTKKMAAMATLESCIGVLRWWGAHLGDLVFDLGPYSADYPGAKGT